MSSNNDIMVGNRPLSTLRVVDLKQELEKYGLSKSGTKKDLAERLRLHLQIKKHRDTGASADEEELPNYSVHEELADQNPFIRDYLASQAELFHSQKVVKKLVEEEAKRESETSADEGVDSPVKQPSALERENSPIPVPEPRRQSRRRGDSQSQKEEMTMTAEKLVTRSSRSRSPAAATEPETKINNIQVQNDKPKKLEVAVVEPVVESEDLVENPKIKPSEEPSEEVKEKADKDVSVLPEVKDIEKKKDEQEESTSNKELQKEETMEKEQEPELVLSEKEETLSSKSPTCSPLKPGKSPEEKIENDEKIEKEEEVKKIDNDKKIEKEEEVRKIENEKKTTVIENEKEKNEEKEKEPEKPEHEEEKKEGEKTEQEEVKKEEEDKKEVVEKVVDNAEKTATTVELLDIHTDKSNVQGQVADGKHKLSRSRSSSPALLKVDKPMIEEPEPEQKTSKRQEDLERDSGKDDSGSSSEESSSRSRGRSRSRSRSPFRSKSRSRSRSQSRSRSRSVESRDERKEESPRKQRKSGGEIDDESKDADAALLEPSKKKRRSSGSVSKSPVHADRTVKEKPKKIKTDETHEEETEKMEEQLEPKPEPEVKSSIEEDTKEDTSARYKSSQKDSFSTKYDLAGEEALDYGEEEEDEDRAEGEKSEFSWTRRILHLKSKTFVPAPTVGTCKWKLEEDGKHLVVKSDFLNNYYRDVKLVPLEQLKLEERAAEKDRNEREREGKKEIERKTSISKEKESESEEPLLTRTVENVLPSVKRTVSIVPISKTANDQPEESDKTLTPPRNPPSNVLLVTNLVRPFTLPQLKELLQRTGNLQDIWVDKIKSKCIVMFKTQEEAFETRAALHGVCWPSSNPKSLHVDYTTQDNLDEHKAKDSAEQNSVIEKPVKAQPLPVREWDVGKKAEPKSPGRNRKRSRSRSTSRDRNKRSRRSSSPGRRRHSRSPALERRSKGVEGKEPEPMGKALDELFRKTIATPSIYWLPLTPEQIAEKEELRRKRMLERERRLAELSKMRPR